MPSERVERVLLRLEAAAKEAWVDTVDIGDGRKVYDVMKGDVRVDTRPTYASALGVAALINARRPKAAPRPGFRSTRG